MKRITIYSFVVILFAFIFASCAAAPAVPSTSGSTVPSLSALPSDTASTTPKESGDLGSLSAGLHDDCPSDDYGPYITYTGGEMSMGYEIGSSGKVRESGIGILLFLDGQPQPYRLEGESTYTYLHTFYPEKPSMVVDFYFTPVTGQEGDDLEMYALAILNPEYRPSVGPQQMMVFTSGSVGAGWRLKFEATPPEADFPEKQHRLYDAEITSENASYGDVFEWSEEDLRERLDSRSYVNDAPHNGQNRVYNITADTPVDLRYELWGTPYIKSSVIFYVDNEPVYTSDGLPFDMAVASGEKKILTAKLDMTGFTGESVLYIVRVPRNYHTSEIRTYGFIQGEGTWFLLAGEKPAG